MLSLLPLHMIILGLLLLASLSFWLIGLFSLKIREFALFFFKNNNSRLKLTLIYLLVLPMLIITAEVKISKSVTLEKQKKYVFTDTSAGLIFQEDPWIKKMTWNEALSYCQKSKYAGFDDWRLPTGRELLNLSQSFSSLSLVKDSKKHELRFVTSTNGDFWSSTKSSKDSKVNVVNLKNSKLSSFENTNTTWPRCVREIKNKL